MGATTDDVIGFDFEVDEKAILDRLLESTSVVSTKFEKALVDKLNKAFENAGRKSGKAVQLGGVYQKLFDDFASASGDIDLLSKAIDNFAGRISYLDKISNKAKSQGIEGILDSLTVGDINKILKNYDSIIEKQEKINEISSDINRKKITDKIERDIEGIDQLIGKYGSKGIDEYNKKLNDFLTEKFNKNPNLTPTIDTKKAADEYASLLTTFENLSKNGAKQGTEKYVKQQIELLSVMKQIQLFEQKNDLFKGFRTTQKDALPLLVKSINELEIQGVKGSVSRLISELTKELKSQISEMYDNVVEITVNYGKKRVEKQAATYEDVVKFLELNTSKKVKVGKANTVPDNDKLDGINKFLVSIEEAEKKIYELASRSSVTDTKIDSRNIDDVMELIGYLQRFQDLGGNIESLNLNRTIIRRFNGKGLEPNVISEENKNAILNLRKEISKAITAGVQDSINETKKELSDSTESKSGLSNGSVNGISDESAKLLTDRLDLIKQEIINSKETSKQEANNIIEKIDETNNLIKDGIQSNLSTISQNVQTIGMTISGMNLQNNNVISSTYKSIADILIDMSKADAIMKDNNIQLHERGFFFNSKTKQHTNEFIYGEEHGIPIKLLKDAIENLVVDSMMHKHTGKYAAMSFAEKEGAGDLFTFKKLKDQGINNQIIAAQENVQIFDAKKFYDKYGEFFENVTDEVISSLHNQIYKEMHNIATEPTRESDLLEAISQVRIPFETFINNIDAITPEIKDILNSDEFQKRFINALKNSEDGMYAAIDSFLENEGIKEQTDFGDNFSNWISDTENGMILVAQKAQENILKKYLNDNSFSLSDYTKTLSLDDYKKQNGGFNGQLQDQSSPSVINVKPVLNPQEFADEVTEQLKGFHTNIDVRAKVEDENLFVTEVTQSLNGWNANIAVQPGIDTPSNFADSVSEQIRFSPAQIPVEPLSEGEFDSERFAQQVTNRLIGESAKINVDLNGSDNQNWQPNINIEVENLNGLNEALDDITRRIGQKTSAFVNEQGVVEKVVNVEKAKLTDLKDAIDGVTKSVNDKTKAFNDEAKAVNAAIQAEKKQQEESEKRQQKSTKKNRDEYDEEYVKILNSAYADADENLKREAEEQAIINKLKAEGIKQEQEFSKHQKQNRDELKKYSDELLKLSDESNTSKYPTIYKDALAKIKNEVEQVESLNIVSDKDLENIKGLVDNLKQTEKLANKAKVSSLIVEIQKYLEKNTKLPTQTRKELKGLIDELNRLDIVKSDVQDVVSKFKDLDAEMIQAGKTGKGLLQAIGEKAFYRTAQYIATFFSFQDLVRYARAAVSTIRELDTELVDLQKTAKMSSSELNRFYLSSNNVAKQMGVTTKEIISQASAWSRLGYSTADQATKMAELSSKFASISPGMNVDTATDGLVSTMKAFNIEVEDAERQIADNINRIGNTAATSNQEIVDMLTRSSAAMAAANNTIEETIALETAAVEITRNAETTGTAFKTLAMRIRGYDEETEELSDDLQNIAGDIADLTKIDGKGGISLFTDETKETYKSTYQILKEISEIWDQLSDKNQAQLLEKLAGKRGGQVVAGLLSNFDAAEKAINEMSQAAGSADAEMSIIEQSIDYKLNRFQQTWVGIAQNLIDRGDIGKIVDAGTKLSEIIGAITDKLGLLGTVGLGTGGFFGIKNLGRGKMLPLKLLTI